MQQIQDGKMQPDATANNQSSLQERVHQRDLVHFGVLYSITFGHWKPELSCQKTQSSLAPKTATPIFSVEHYKMEVVISFFGTRTLNYQRKGEQDFAEGS